MNFKVLVMAWLLLLLSLVSGATATTLEWSKETVDSQGDTGLYNSIAHDSYDNPHISYWKSAATGEWSNQTVVHEGDVGEYSSMVLDPNGGPHISYWDSTNEEVKYATMSEGQWVTYTIDNSTGLDGVSGSTSIAIDSDWHIHVTYCDDYGLNYAEWNGDKWFVNKIDESGSGTPSIAIDSSNNPHISYISYDSEGFGERYLNYTKDVGNGWVTQTVDPGGGDSILGVSLALNSSGVPHISYQNGVDLKIAWVGGKEGWSINTIDSLGFGDHTTSLAIDSSDKPHISYRADDGTYELRYARLTDLGWSTQTVLTGDVGNYNSIAIDSSGVPHISYYYSQNMEYVTKVGGLWSNHTVDSEGDVGKYCSIAIDLQDGKPHVSYFDQINFDLKHAKLVSFEGKELRYATWTGTDWLIQAIASSQGLESTSIAIDSSDNPHVSYCDDSGLNYATWTGSGWSTQTIDNSCTGKSSIAIDSSGTPHIGYIGYSGESFGEVYLNYTMWTGTGWSTQTITADSCCIYGVSLALDSSDNPHISYEYDDGLKYTTRSINGWSIQNIDSMGFGEHSTSIAVDSSDKPHISYTYGSSYDLRYATPSGTGWEIDEVVYGFGDTGKYSSIAIDASDNPHISYHSSTSNSLKHAKLEGDTWSKEDIDSGEMGLHSSITIDTSDNPHISYLDNTGKNLKYARVTGTPAIVTLQGKLTDSTGNPVQTGSVRVTVKSGGSQLWQNTFEDELDDGVFNIALGAVKPMYLTTGEIYRMVVEIDADSTTFSSADVTFGDNSPYDDIIKFKA